MDVETLRAIGADLMGNGWQTRLAKALGVDGSTVRRWLSAGGEAPGPVAAFLGALGDRQETRGALLAERTARPRAVAFAAPVRVVLDHMRRRIAFPGVDRPKPMPAVHAARDADGRLDVRLDGAAADAIAVAASERLRLSMVRHPDGRHLRGYADAAARAGLDLATASHRFHHYTLAVHEADGDGGVVDLRIATHGGDVRRVVVRASDDVVVHRSLSTILEREPPCASS